MDLLVANTDGERLLQGEGNQLETRIAWPTMRWILQRLRAAAPAYTTHLMTSMRRFRGVCPNSVDRETCSLPGYYTSLGEQQNEDSGSLLCPTGYHRRQPRGHIIARIREASGRRSSGRPARSTDRPIDRTAHWPIDRSPDRPSACAIDRSTDRPIDSIQYPPL